MLALSCKATPVLEVSIFDVWNESYFHITRQHCSTSAVVCPTLSSCRARCLRGAGWRNQKRNHYQMEPPEFAGRNRSAGYPCMYKSKNHDALHICASDNAVTYDTSSLLLYCGGHSPSSRHLPQLAHAKSSIAKELTQALPKLASCFLLTLK